MPSSLVTHWKLDPSIAFLNHGSFGACPRVVLEEQSRFRDRLEEEPIRFFMRDLEPIVDRVREELAAFLGADAAGIAFVTNATMGVNAVVRSLSFAEGDEVLTTNHAYHACKNALEFAAVRMGAKLVVAEVPFPIASEDQVVEAILAKVSPRTKLALVDHVTSPTGLVFPIARIVKELDKRGVDTVVDGAHAPGMLPLDIKAINAAYYTGNLHKWVCAPKGVAFLHVRADKREAVRPTVISHGADSSRCDRSRYWAEFDWMGTFDPTGICALPAALAFLPSLVDGGWPAVYASNHDKALAARARLVEALGVEAPAPPSMIGSLAAVELPKDIKTAAVTHLEIDPLQGALFEQFKVEVPIVPWKPRRLVRVSAQLYNDESDYERLIEGLKALL